MEATIVLLQISKPYLIFSQAIIAKQKAMMAFCTFSYVLH